MEAFRVISDPNGLNIGPRHITISTSGRVEEIRRFACEKGPCPHLAVSINAPSDELRTRLMPINRKHPMQELYEAIKFYNETTGKEVLVAYVLMKGLNDQPHHAEELSTFLKGLQVKVNLIPYNAQVQSRYQTPEDTQVADFKRFMVNHGYSVLVRKTRGAKIMAACGQLSTRKFLQENTEKIIIRSAI